MIFRWHTIKSAFPSTVIAVECSSAIWEFVGLGFARLSHSAEAAKRGQ
jgi:hypothetical protein